MEAHENQAPLPLQSHTILGVCEAIGQDFGFNPVFLRVPFAASVILSPTWAIGSYFALGLAVLLSRLLAPSTKARPPVKETEDMRSEAPVANDERQMVEAA